MAERIKISTNPELYKSAIGTPVYSDLNITGDTYTVNGLTRSFTDIKLPEALFKVSREHKIIRTEINGLEGEILEYIGTKNWEIDVDIKLTGMNLLYPQEVVANILSMLSSNQVLTVNSWYLNKLGITNFVVLSESEPQTEGDLNNQRISFKALSVTPLITQNNPITAGSGSGGNSVA